MLKNDVVKNIDNQLITSFVLTCQIMRCLVMEKKSILLS